MERQRANTKEEDPGGLLNEGWRYRDLEAGVFLSRDPAGMVDGPNLYAYVRQNPWTKFDPQGLSTKLNLDGTTEFDSDSVPSYRERVENNKTLIGSAKNILTRSMAWVDEAVCGLISPKVGTVLQENIVDNLADSTLGAPVHQFGEYVRPFGTEPNTPEAKGANLLIAGVALAIPILAEEKIELAPKDFITNSGVRERVLANVAANRAATGNIRHGLTTMDLRALTTIAADEVDALGASAFTARQQRALINNPSLGAAFRGSAIDKRVRIEVQNEPFLRHLQGQPNRGADFIDPATGNWWDMTTPGQWPVHVQKYGPGGTLLPTR